LTTGQRADGIATTLVKQPAIAFLRILATFCTTFCTVSEDSDDDDDDDSQLF
jgi:hypothetical protein